MGSRHRWLLAAAFFVLLLVGGMVLTLIDDGSDEPPARPGDSTSGTSGRGGGGAGDPAGGTADRGGGTPSGKRGDPLGGGADGAGAPDEGGGEGPVGASGGPDKDMPKILTIHRKKTADLQVVRAATYRNSAIALSPDGTRLAAVAKDLRPPGGPRLRVIDTLTGKVLATRDDGLFTSVRDLGFGADGKSVFVLTHGSIHEYLVRDLSRGRRFGTQRDRDRNVAGVEHLRLAGRPKGLLLLIASQLTSAGSEKAGLVVLPSPRRMGMDAPLISLRQNVSPPACLAATPDGTFASVLVSPEWACPKPGHCRHGGDRLYAVSLSEMKLLWEKELRPRKHRLRKRPLARPLAVQPEAGLIAVGADDGSIRLLAGKDGGEVRRLESEGLDGAVQVAAFARKGSVLLTGHAGGRMALWDVAAKRLLETMSLRKGEKPVHFKDLRLSDDLNVVATLTDDGRVRIFTD